MARVIKGRWGRRINNKKENIQLRIWVFGQCYQESREPLRKNICEREQFKEKNFKSAQTHERAKRRSVSDAIRRRLLSRMIGI